MLSKQVYKSESVSMVFLVTFDLWSILCLCIIPPIILLLCKLAWEIGDLFRIISRNAYVDKVTKENNEIWKENIHLIEQVKELRDKDGYYYNNEKRE